MHESPDTNKSAYVESGGTGSCFGSMGARKDSQDMYIGKSGVGVGGLRMSGFGGSGLLGVGGVGFGDTEVVEEGHVGRMVGRFECRSYHEHRQDFDQDSRGASVAIDIDHDDDDDDGKTSTYNNDVESPFKSPTNTTTTNRS